MSANITKVIERAREVLEQLGRCEVTKTIWSSPAGKKRIAKRLVKMLPPHKTYVEPFAGSAAVLFAKEPAEVWTCIKKVTYSFMELLSQERLRLSGTSD